MNNSQSFCWSGTLRRCFLPGLVRHPKSPIRPRSFSGAMSHLVTRWWAGGTGKKAVMDSLTHTSGLRQALCLLVLTACSGVC